MPFFLIWYMIAILPMIIFLEGYKKLSEYIPEKNPWLKKIYMILIMVGLILIVLLLAGYR